MSDIFDIDMPDIPKAKRRKDYVRRDMGQGKPGYEWLRYQIGTEKVVKVQTSPNRWSPETIFTLLAFGSSWEEANDMLDKRGAR